jgi:hypothetical protein
MSLPDRIQITTDDVTLYDHLLSLAQRNKFFKLFGRKWFVQRIDQGDVSVYPYRYSATLNSVVEILPIEKDAAV